MAFNYNANSTYLYGTYYYHLGNNNNNTTDGLKYDFLIQITIDATHTYFIDALTGNYFKIDKITTLKQQDIFTKLIKPIYDVSIDTTQFRLFTYPNKKQSQDTILFNYFLERCNLEVILPVKLGQQRYFVKDIVVDDEEEAINYNKNENFHPSAYEEDEEAPASLIHNMCDIDVESCKFIDPILGTQYNYIIFRSTIYIEKSKEDYDKIINRIEPITISSSIGNTQTKLNAAISEILGTPFDINNKSTIKIIDIIQENFGKHISFDKQLQPFINSPPASTINILKAKISTIKESDIPPVPLLALLSDDIGGDKYFKVINFLRSYIDLYHDIENYATEYFKTYYNLFIKDNPETKDFLDNQITIINQSIFTRTGNINQEKCREQIDRVTDLFITYLHNTKNIQTNPINKQNARIMSASIDNPIQIKSLVDTLKADGVEGFYIESANNNIGTILHKNNIKICNLTIGEWDAGSGFSGKKLKPKPEILEIGPSEAGGKFILPNMSIDMFGLFNVSVAPNNNTLVTSYKGTPIITVTPRQKLSVNKILIATGKAAIRGTDDTKPATLIFTVNPSPLESSALITLKPWTDLIQIKSISGSKILTIIYDTLCETTARMYGLYHVLLCQGKILTYYSYNINSRNLNYKQVQGRTLLQYFINTNALWIKQYLTTWFTQKINTLQQLITITNEPILFFISKAFIEKYTSAYNKSIELIDQVETINIKSLPDTLDEYIESVSSSSTLLADLMELYLQFKTAIEGINSVGSRGNKEIFLDAYKATQRLIITTFKTGDEKDTLISLRAMVACTFAYYFIKTPRSSVFLGKLDDIKRDILHEQYKNYTRPQINRGYKVTSGNTYTQPLFNTSLPKIKESNNEIVRNIVDIQIAIQTLLTTPPVKYRDYIQQVSLGKIATIPDYSFNNAITRVTDMIDNNIKSKGYFGGKKLQKKYSKTYKHKRSKLFKLLKLKTHKKRKL